MSLAASTDSAMSLAVSTDEEMKKTSSLQGFEDDHLASASWYDGRVPELNPPVSLNQSTINSAPGHSDSMAVHPAPVSIQRSNPATRMYPRTASESLNNLDKFHARFMNHSPLFGSGSDGGGSKVSEHPLPLSYYYPQPVNAPYSPTVPIDPTLATSRNTDNGQKNLCGGKSGKHTKRIDSIFMRQSNAETSERSEETTAEKESENLDNSSDRSVHSGSEHEYPVSHSSDSEAHSCDESFQNEADEVISVADRIELELKKYIGKVVESDSGSTAVESSSSETVRSNKKDDVGDTEHPPNSLPKNVLQEYQTFVRKAAMYACQRLEMELDDDNNEASLPTDVWDDSFLDDVKKQKKKKKGKSKKSKTSVSKPDNSVRKDLEKQEKDGKSEKPDTSLPKPGILTFTVDRLFTFIIEEMSSGEFTCKNCKMVFSSEDDARGHVMIHSPYKCDSCDITFTCLADMKVHYRVDHKEILHCNYCTYSSQLKADFERHVKSKHRSKRITNIQMACYICGLCFPVWEPLDDHMEKEHGIKQGIMEGDFQCPLCNFLSRSEKMFRDHVREHEGKYFECTHPGCDFRNVCPGRVNLHIKIVHEGRRKFSCPIEGCGARFPHGQDIDEHLNVVHYKIRKFFCETCGKGFLAKKHLNVHERIHSDVKPIGCRFCDYRCRQSASLKWHMKQSHPEMVSLEASFTSTTEVQGPNHQFKRGRKSTGKREESAAKQREGSVQENYGDVRQSKKRKISSELDSDGDGFLWPNIPQIGDATGQDQAGNRAGTGQNFVPEYPRLYYPTIPGYPFPYP